MRKHGNRRTFLKTTTLAAGTALAFPCVVRGAETKKLRIAIVGVGGRGRHGLNMAKNEEIVALCDVDTGRLSGARQNFLNAETYQDYREMLSDLGDRVDAVVISTPDHTHFHATMAAMNLGKHVYTQKPLTHTM